VELLESNNLLAGWSGFELGSTPVQSKKITANWPILKIKTTLIKLAATLLPSSFFARFGKVEA
jgi:hypothetical protein